MRLAKIGGIIDQLAALLTGEYERYIKKGGGEIKRYQKIDLRKILEMELKTFLLNQVLRKSDMAAIVNGVEVRAPFLYETVVQASHGYELGDLNNLLTNKRPLRKLLSLYNAEKLIEKRKKGFQLNTSRLMAVDLKNWTTASLEGGALSGIFDREFYKGDDRKKWNCAILNAWLKYEHKT